MADNKKTEEAPAAAKRHPKLHEFLEGFIGGVPAAILIELGVKVFEHQVKKAVDAPKHQVNYSEALAALQVKNPAAADKMRHFVRVGLKTEKDRVHFQEHVAKVGGDNVGPSVAILELMSALPDDADHKSRREFAEEMGYIGHRAMELPERAVEVIKATAARSGGLSAATILKIKDGIVAFENSTTLQNAETSSATAKATATQRLADYKARR